MPTRPLCLHEEVLLLALRDEEGAPHPGAWAQSAIGGAVLGELFLGGHIRTENDGKQDVVATVHAPGDALLADCFAQIAESPARRPAQFWAGLFACRADLIPRTAAELCRLGVLRTDEKKVLLLFKRKLYPEVDPVPESALIERMRVAIFEDGAVVEPRTAVLVAVGNQTGLLNANFDEEQLATRQSRIDGIVKGNFAGDATRDAVQASHAFFFIASVTPLMVMRS